MCERGVCDMRPATRAKNNCHNGVTSIFEGEEYVPFLNVGAFFIEIDIGIVESDFYPYDTYTKTV